MIFLVLGCSLAMDKLLTAEELPIVDGWEHGNLVQIANSSGSSSSFLLLPANKGAVYLIDAVDGSEDGILERLEDEGRSAEDVEGIFLTHGHTSHVQGISDFPNAEIHALDEEQDLLDQEGVRLDVSLAAGDIYTLGASELEVFSVSGHSFGNAAYRFDDVLVFGDSALSHDDDSITAGIGGDDDSQMAELSLKYLRADLSLRESEFSYSAFSHSGPLEGIDALLAFESH
jgi:glyoxylase-like metal-dependent hydrolase (beta-lactamase superfamily II)